MDTYQEQELHQHQERKAMHQNLGTSDADVVGILNQFTIKAGKLPRPSEHLLRPPVGKKEPHLPDTLEPKDDEPSPKRPKSSHGKDEEAEPSDPMDIAPASVTVGATTTRHAPTTQDAAPRRGLDRAAKSQSTVIGQDPTPQLSEVDEEQHRHHGNDSDPGDSGQSIYQHIEENDSGENEKVPDADTAEDKWSISSSEAGSDESEHGLEFFGLHQAWKGITTATKLITRCNKAPSTPPSQQMKQLIEVIEGARQVYRSTTEMPEISEAVTKLYQTVADLSEASCKEKERRDIITFIYFDAVPELVDLLKAVIKGRRKHLQDEDSLAVLKEVIGVQDCLIILCTKARNWRAKPITDQPIKQPVRQIRLKIDTIRSAFRKEYDRRKVHLKRISNQAKSKASEEDRIEREKIECQEKQRRLEERRRQVREDVFRSQLMSSPRRHRACKDRSMVCKASQSAR
ncbi:MAG: hypothetical protein Q9212_003455 [Teloschistes hypoglaucus]